MVRALALVLVLCPLAASAQADRSSRALVVAQVRGLITQAQAHYADGGFAEARRLLARARRRAKGEVSLLGRIELLYGLACAAENRREEARTAWIRAVLLDPTLRINPQRYKPSLVKLFEGVRASVQASLEVALQGKRRATVWIDERRIEGPPFQVRLAPGRHQLEVRDATGGTLLRQQVELAPGQRARVLVAAPAPKDTPAPHRERPWFRQHRWTLISASAAVAAGGVALGLGLSAVGDRDQACGLLAGQDLPCDQRSRLQDVSSRPRYESLRADIDTKRRWTNAMIGISAGLAVVAVVAYWLERRERPQGRSSSLSLGPGAIQLRF